MALYFSGWGYKEEILRHFVGGIDSGFDVVVWSLGLARLYRFLLNNPSVFFDSVLFIAPAYGFEQDYVDEFVRGFSSVPEKELGRFYRRAHWNSRHTPQAVEGFLMYGGDYQGLLEELKELLNTRVDVDVIKGSMGCAVCVIAGYDLIVPKDFQAEFADLVKARAIEIDAPHFCLDRIESVLKNNSSD